MTNLTDKWKKGKLPDGLYWVKYKNGFIDIEEHITHHHGFSYDEKERIEEVLAQVPSYDEWKKAYECVVSENEEITTLKELLKRAKEILEDEGDYMIVQEIKQVLGEE